MLSSFPFVMLFSLTCWNPLCCFHPEEKFWNFFGKCPTLEEGGWGLFIVAFHCFGGAKFFSDHYSGN